MAQPTVYEQYMLELVNRGRSNPQAEADRFDIDLNEGLASGTITDSAKQPLAFDFDLIDAARDHSQWMLATDTFSHTGEGGSNPGERMEEAGYEFTGDWRWGENIAWQGTTGTPDVDQFVADEHEALFLSSGHRKNLLQNDFREVGIGVLEGEFDGYNAVVTTQNFAKSGSSLFLTGVVYDDQILDNDFYTVGEGLGDIEIEAVRQSDAQKLTTTTFDSGGYQLEVSPGDYEVTFSGSDWQQSFAVDIEDRNVKLDLATNEIEVQPQAEPASAPPAESTIGEVGRIDSIDHQTIEIELKHEYNNPVIFVQPLSSKGGDPATVRITEQKSDRFSAYLQEPSNNDGFHVAESLSYLVLEAGTWQLEDGTLLEVGTIDTNANVGSQWTSLDFEQSFEAAPVVLSQVQTQNDADFMRTRQQNLNAEGVSIALEQEELLKNADYDSETIGWLAIDAGIGTWNGLDYQAGITEDAVTHTPYELDFAADFGDAPELLASIGSYDGPNSAGLRYQDLTPSGVGLKVQEDTSKDAETLHTTENINFLGIEAGTLSAVAI